MTLYFDAAKQRINLGAQIAQGGEGWLFEVAGSPTLIAKIYKPGRHPDVNKIVWMQANPPHDPTAKYGHASIAWPRTVLYDTQGKFAGFVMPRIRFAGSLNDLYIPKNRRKLPFASHVDWKFLHHMASNFASCVEAIHDKGYVIGDINQSNVVFNEQAMVTVVDTDSFQVRAVQGGQPRTFRCGVFQEEFLPPEISVKFSTLRNFDLADMDREPYHDAYGLAVLIFKLLFNGVHPLDGVWTGPGDPPSAAVIREKGYFPYRKPPFADYQPSPFVISLDVLHPDLTHLFQRCFVDGLQDPRRRPTAEDWHDALNKAEATLQPCGNGHLYSKHSPSTTCPWCARQGTPAARVKGRQTPHVPIQGQVATATPTRVTTPPPATRPIPPPPPVSTSYAAPAPQGRRPARLLTVAGGGAGVVMLFFLISRMFGGAGGDLPAIAVIPPTATAVPTATAIPTATAVPTVTPLPAIASGCWTAANQLPAVRAPGGAAGYQQWSAPPAMVIDAARRYVATIITSKGPIMVQLDAARAPLAVNNFVCLARAGFYDNTAFHRVVPGSAVQAGDPSGTGVGGPGYLLADEPVVGDYTRGTLALVNSGPDSNGSQFILFVDDLSQRLPRRYPIFGHITLGLDVLDTIASDPASPTTIDQVLITQSG